MKWNKIISLFVGCGQLLLSIHGIAEGTKEIMKSAEDYAKLRMDKGSSYNDFALYTASANERLHIRIGNLGEKIHFGFGSWGGNTLYCRIKDPSGTIVWGETAMTYAAGTKGYISSYAQAIAGPDVLDPAGYMPFTYVPETTGDYYIEFNFSNGSRELDYFDITVIDTTDTPLTAIKGRVFSKAWQFSSGDITSNPGSKATLFVCADDSVVTSLYFNGMQGHAFEVSCNQNGCYPPPTSFQTSRMSNSAHVGYPQYKIFLNDPDILQFPSGVPGNIVPGTVNIEAFCNGTFVITFSVTKAGSAEVFLDINPAPGIQAEDVILSNSVTIGSNAFTWDGNNGLGNPVPNGTLIKVSVSYINGLTNFPVWDVESHPNGFIVELVRPTGSSPTLFWDDTGPGVGGGQNLAGCISAVGAGCHSWIGDYYSGIGNENTINTWWYATSTSTDPVTMPFKRFPPDLGIITGLTQICQGAGSVIYTVNPEPNTTEYFWAWPSGWNAISTPPYSNSIELNVTGTAVTGNITVHGENTECGAGPISALAVTILPIPALSNSPMNKTICSGDNVNITLTSATPGTAYSWTVTSTPNITGYPASGFGAAISHTLTNSINTPGTVWYVITPSANGCNGEDTTYTVTVSPKPVITNPLPYSKTICSEAFTDLTITSSIPMGTTFSWTVSPNTLGATAGSNATGIINQQLTNPGATILSVTYTITPDNNGCIGNSINYVVTVNPEPLVTNAPPSKTICSGIGTNISLTSNVAGASFAWTVVDNPNVTGEMNGSGSLINQTLTNNSYISQDVAYTITPTANACPGPSIDYTVTIQPDPDVSNTILDFSQCSGETTNINLTSNVSGTAFSWTASGPPGTSGFNNGSGALIAQQLFNSNLTSAIVQFVVTPSANSCNGTSKTFNVTVHPLPVPTIAGPTARCLNTSGVYTTQAGMTNYTWVVPPGAGTITSGAGTNTITVNWIATGMHTISVNFNDINGCTAVSPTTYNITVNPLPNPTVSGPGAVCLNQSNTYSTEMGMSNYTWTLSPDGNILSGGGTASVNISWGTIGVKTVSINYNDPNGCTAPAPTAYPVNVNVLPVPTLSGLDQVCVNNTETYTTESGMQSYQWTVSPGGTVMAGGTATSPSVTVTWTAIGARTVSVNYSLGTGCAGAAPTVYNVMVNPRPSPNISGPLQACELSQNVIYQALPSTLGNTYDWTVAGGTIVSGQGTSTLTVNWGSYGTGLLDVNETITTTGCDAPAPTFSVTLDPYPLLPDPITGVDEICRAQSGLLFSVPPVTYATSTIWNYTGTGITFTQIDPLTVSIDFGLTATSGLLQVQGNNACGNGPVMEKFIDVHPLPVISFALCQDTCSIDTKPFILRGAYPFGGSYSGQGVMGGNSFDPTTLLPGNYHIRYTIANTFTCVDSAYALMTVIPATPALTCGQLLTDARDGKQYPTVMIGSRCWMAQNLNHGVRIQDILTQKDNCSREKYCYDNNPANCSAMGGLYQWHEAMQFTTAEGAQGICPASWHVATEDDWADLFAQYSGPSQSGNPMKTTGFSGFNATFSGATFQNLISDFSNEAAFFWSSTQHGKDHAWTHALNVETPSVSFKPALKANAFYVRCVRD